jgi:hypothetical protein
MATRKKKNDALVENVLDVAPPLEATPAPRADARDEGLLDPSRGDDEARVEASLRPTRLSDFVGQRRVTDNLKVFVEAARRREEPLDHVLLLGPAWPRQDHAREHPRARRWA